MKLISMSDFVLKQGTVINTGEMFYRRVYKYASFLKQPLNLGMFIPCDEGGRVLEEPTYSEPISENNIGDLDELIYEYDLAKECVLFEGFKKCNRSEKENCVVSLDLHINLNYMMLQTIEDLVKYNLTLRKSAIEALGL